MAATQDADEECLDGSNYATGSAEDQSAYRSEVAGTIGVLATMAILVKQFSITSQPYATRPSYPRLLGRSP